MWQVHRKYFKKKMRIGTTNGIRNCDNVQSAINLITLLIQLQCTISIKFYADIFKYLSKRCV